MMSFNRPVTSSVYVTVLRKDLPSPLAPESDDEQEAKPEPSKKDEAAKATAPPTVKVDFEKISQRILALPIPARNYAELAPGKEGELFIVESPAFQSLSGPETLTAYRFALKTRKTDKLQENLLAFYVSADGEKMLYRTATGNGAAAAPKRGPLDPFPKPIIPRRRVPPQHRQRPSR